MQLREKVFEQIRLIYTIGLIFFCYNLFEWSNDLVIAVGIFVVLEVAGIFVLAKWEDLWKSDDEEEV